MLADHVEIPAAQVFYWKMVFTTFNQRSGASRDGMKVLMGVAWAKQVTSLPLDSFLDYVLHIWAMKRVA